MASSDEVRGVRMRRNIGVVSFFVMLRVKPEANPEKQRSCQDNANNADLNPARLPAFALWRWLAVVFASALTIPALLLLGSIFVH